MPKSAKNNVRSFRYSDDIKEILEGFKGDNLNEKFDNLVRYCFERLPYTEKRLSDLESEINRKRQMLFDVRREVMQIELLISELHSIKSTVELVSRRARNIVENDL